MSLQKYTKITNPIEAAKARMKILNIEGITFTPKDMKVMQYLTELSIRDIPDLQLWIRSSSGSPQVGWTNARWQKFHKELPKYATNIKVPIYRGTHLPWIVGKKSSKKLTKKNIQKISKQFLQDFDSKKPLKLPDTISFTTNRKIAKNFAKQRKGDKIIHGLKFDDGFIHIINPYIEAVHVPSALKKLKVIKIDGSDEQLVADLEQEVLLPTNTTIVPVKRSGRTFEWEFVK